MEERTRRVLGATIRSLEGGEGEPLLLLPSAAGRATEYRELFPILEKRFHLYAIDYPGFGKSDPLSGMKGVDDLAGFVLAWLDAAGLERVHLAGFSMGGWISLSLALSHPERIIKLILIATSGGELPGIPIVSPAGMNFKQILDQFYYRPEVRERLARQKLSLEEKEEVLRSSRALNDLVRSGKVIPEFHEALGKMQIPTLIVGADHDRAIPLPYQERLHAAISRSQLVVFQETGHAIVAERPKELAEEIERFILTKNH
jgi:pimeloyl-ACP methyl ester carboxylesterase